MYQFIHLEELDTLSILLENTVRKEIIDKVVSSFGNQRKLAAHLNIGQYTISRWRTGRVFIPLQILKYLEQIDPTFKVRKIENYVEKIGSKQGSNPLPIEFPVEINEDMGYLVGLFLTDGHIDKKLNWAQFTNKDEAVKTIFLQKIRNLFHYSNYYQTPKDRKQIYIKNKVIATILSKIGIPIGKKTGIIKVPELIIKSNKSVIASFLRGCFDGDGSVCFSPKIGLRIINFASTSKQMLEDMSFLLSKFDIQNSITFNKRGRGYINITNKINIKKFSEEINFNHLKRKEKLDYILKSYKT